MNGTVQCVSTSRSVAGTRTKDATEHVGEK